MDGKEQLRRVLQQPPRPCLLCGGDPVMSGVFFPQILAEKDPTRSTFLTGLLEGKTRVLVYWLCAYHAGYEDKVLLAKEVENKFMQDMDEMLRKPNR